VQNLITDGKTMRRQKSESIQCSNLIQLLESNFLLLLLPRSCPLRVTVLRGFFE
jgi:hypothetical protein